MKNNKVNCDILVVGAGISGVAAAVAAARQKSSVILLEQNDFPGGTPIIAMHNFICGIKRDNVGLLKEIIAKTALGEKPVRRGKVMVMPFKTERMTAGLNRIIQNERRIRAFYCCSAVSVEVLNNRIALVIAKYASGKMSIVPKAVIDASGEGKIIKLSKAKYNSSALNKRQLSGFSFKVKGIKGDSKILAWKVPYYLAKGAVNNNFPEYFKFSLFSPGYSRDEGFIKLNIPPLKRAGNSKATVKTATFIHNYLRKNLPEFKNSYITQVSPKAADREGIRLSGEYILSKKDVLEAKKHLDAVAKGCWPIEFWDRKKGLTLTYLKKGGSYEVPLRSLKSRNINNLFAAGRCISADPYALASTRVMGTCISLGEAAGIAASNYAHTLS